VLVVELRRTLLLPLDDLLAVTREFINPGVSRSGLDRCLRRHGVSDLVSFKRWFRTDSRSPISLRASKPVDELRARESARLSGARTVVGTTEFA
jgi:hypothetical protein